RHVRGQSGDAHCLGTRGTGLLQRHRDSVTHENDQRLTHYTSPLGERYASAEMLRLWSPATRHGLWRQLWLALAESEQQLGVPIPDEALAQMRKHLDDIDFAAVAAYEKRFRHDVMAHINAFGDVAPAARGFIHLGATSAFVTDNADLLLMREGMQLLLDRVLGVLSELAEFARQW